MKMRMNSRIMKIILIACLAAISLAFIVRIFFAWTFFPVKSSPQTLSIALYSGGYANKPVITLKHFIDGVHARDYTLIIKNGVHIQDPQKYILPKLAEGTIEVSVELGDEENSTFSISFSSASELYENGLLIYLTDNESQGIIIDLLTYYNKYAYLVSGEKKTCYFNEAASSRWVVISDAPSLKSIKRNEPDPFYVWDSKWKENKWEIVDIKRQKP